MFLLEGWIEPSAKMGECQTEGMDEVLDFLKFCYEELDGNKKIVSCMVHYELVDNTNVFRDARDKGHAILDALIDVSLLERSDKKKCVKMNKPCEGLQDFPDRKEWEDASRISLMGNQLCTLPEFLHCHNLSTLLLQMNNGLIAIPEFFFESMCSLRVLDLHGTGIESLPSSISNLICLRGLYLNSCPHLIQLPPNMRALEQLEGNPNSKAIGEHLSVVTLKKLTSLRFCFPTVDFLKLFVQEAHYNCLKLVNGEGMHPVIAEVLRVTHAFKLINHKGVSTLSDFGVDNMENMLVCSVEGCNEIRTIVCGDRMASSVLENLEVLHINSVLKLRSIWQGSIPNGSLAQLTTLTLTKCPELKKIFSNGMIQQLPELQHLRVEECNRIEEIIMESENLELEVNALPRLKTLVLIDLPRLRSIWIDDSLEWPSLQRIQIATCHMLKRLPFSNTNALKLRFIEGQQSWWEALVWEDDALKQIYTPFASSANSSDFVFSAANS
ncbi:Disease resistance protein RPS2 [Vitis vinifera]|uniref:Disease resistance protein RPS2 n=1 Tax=Vitis vinifera TaxID=29760 RepID=A0A438FW93_VITVI|nr:Disease resistance protein RPS2 [Vitis vinifera]